MWVKDIDGPTPAVSRSLPTFTVNPRASHFQNTFRNRIRVVFRKPGPRLSSPFCVNGLTAICGDR